VALGLAPVATSSHHLPFEKLITGLALDARVTGKRRNRRPCSHRMRFTRRGHITGPTALFVNGCRAGSDGNRQGGVPKPPEFFKGKGVTDDPSGVTYWKVANGIRLTGMPGSPAR